MDERRSAGCRVACFDDAEIVAHEGESVARTRQRRGGFAATADPNEQHPSAAEGHGAGMHRTQRRAGDP